ncbi:sulfite oxidase heme-binding subunit YedZ [Sulfitobacter geojensis]|uniref:Ferric reductase-like transmembrane domain-containing protein n=1 Tax=Sulfitobacter geojensis TaxID=1342299 RepID=A0AAE3B831_9RHOB|nr:ferric reductase-like transmembrane domain-containing protein [Sulfitobacter geojensis]MBM1690644.1 ferric reductase-like transmembrane domain-containing protein [Sulfitobacter geojensis]MBM1694710.1 ferric reductase-like transmembrane domain-containing protein [Sulfitobacter geojensis]MBM1707584.1 ferric reductase-like transmembrane domain-containing protein [Sulfitobacter geojensis]MBM1711194.1 ferric reductase-like transmembrane domain-containing protein [Sulfitobacter geojensis]MBM17157
MFSRVYPYWFWVLLSLPGLAVLNSLINAPDSKAIYEALHPTGEFAARFMIIGMMASPLAMVFKGWRGPRWLQKNRRYLGVAAFFYALVHTVLYLIDLGTVQKVMAELPRFYIWTGWIAFVIFVPLAVTSSDYFVRKLGRKWKTLQRTTYAAAVLTLLHWAALHDWGGLGPAMVHFVPLGLLKAYRVWYWYLRPRSKVT